jgi:hypothetical protein
MRRLSSSLLLAFAVACGPAPNAVAPIDVGASAPPPTVRGRGPLPEGYVQFAHVPPRVGQSWRVTTLAESRYDELQGEFAGTSYHNEYTVTLLEVSGDAPTKLRAVFHESMRHVLGETEYNEKPTPLRGRTLLLEAPGKVSADDGQPLTKETEALALHVFGDLGLRSRTNAALPDDPVKEGSRMDPFAEAIVRSLNAISWTPVRTEATVKSVGADVVEVALSFSAKTESGMQLDATGVAAIGHKTRLIHAVLLEGTFKGPPPDRAPGTWRVARKVTTSDGPAPAER